eukprot:m.157663 g.157663  ORF g.157663 m.157663 type:complete len:71 (+) comp52967_c0_seq1:1073-1285(+)
MALVFQSADTRTTSPALPLLLRTKFGHCWVAAMMCRELFCRNSQPFPFESLLFSYAFCLSWVILKRRDTT